LEVELRLGLGFWRLVDWAGSRGFRDFFGLAAEILKEACFFTCLAFPFYIRDFNNVKYLN
jgi:hypothetical protein